MSWVQILPGPPTFHAQLVCEEPNSCVGMSGVVQTYDNAAHMPPHPDEEHFLTTFFGFLIVGLYFLGRISTKFKSAFRRMNTVIY